MPAGSALGHSVTYPVATVLESYSTTFGATENPMAEDGLWLQGAANGVDWSNFRTTPGKAFGTQSEGSHGNNQPGGYNDSTALRRARPGRIWGPDQDVRGRVFITTRTGQTGFHEAQLLARGQMRANWLQCYEFIFSVVGGTTYYQIVRFTGPLSLASGDGGWVSLANESAAGVEDGTYCRATAIGTVLRMYTSANGVDWTERNSYDTVNDSQKYADGLPGMMHWTNGNGDPANYGWSEWSCQAAA